MNNKKWWVGCVALAMGGLLGCSDSDGGSNLFNDVTDAEEAAIAALCECYGAVGEASEADCIEEFSESYTAEETTCLEGVYEENEADLTAGVDCRLDALDEAETCLAAVVACEANAVMACFEAAGDAMELCADPPPAVGEAIDACTPNLYVTSRASEVEAIAVLCTCSASLGYATVGECTDDFLDPHTPQQAGCLEDVYDEYESELTPSEDCHATVRDDAVACVEAVVGCDSMALDACLQAAETAGDLCPNAPMAAEDAVDACEPPPP